MFVLSRHFLKVDTIFNQKVYATQECTLNIIAERLRRLADSGFVLFFVVTLRILIFAGFWFTRSPLGTLRSSHVPPVYLLYVFLLFFAGCLRWNVTVWLLPSHASGACQQLTG